MFRGMGGTGTRKNPEVNKFEQVCSGCPETDKHTRLKTLPSRKFVGIKLELNQHCLRITAHLPPTLH